MVKLVTAHTTDEQADSLADYLPNGYLFGAKKQVSTKLRKLLIGLTGLLEDAEEKINLVSDEYDIRITTLFIEEWEGFVGIPDSCFVVADTIEERRQNVLTKLGGLGVQTEADFVALAALFGLTVTITPGATSGLFPMVFPLIFFPTPKDARFTMVVNFTVDDASRFPLTFPFTFGDAKIATLECLFNKLRPATVDVIFNQV
jgi:uncharacterized protein YmfQ (DUF2313 family)